MSMYYHVSERPKALHVIIGAAAWIGYGFIAYGFYHVIASAL